MKIHVPGFTAEGVVARPMDPGVEPRRMLIVRLQAFGDTVGLLPVLAALRDRLPESTLEVVTGPLSAAVFRAHRDVDRVHVLDPRMPRWRKPQALIRLAARLRASPVDAILDLQRSRLSRTLTRLVGPEAFAAFDRFAPRHGLDRYLFAVERIGLGKLEARTEPRIRPEVRARASALLMDEGYGTELPLVLLNPAGGWETKQWPLARYEELGRMLIATVGARPLFLGAGAQLPRIRALATAIGPEGIDLSGRTTPDLAMALAARCSLAVSDDSGLMHLAWVQGVPTIAIFGASRDTWCRPLGSHTSGFYSSDLACGACMQPDCARGDIHCLDRVSVEMVLDRCLMLLRPPTMSP